MKKLLLNTTFSHDGYLGTEQGRIVIFDGQIVSAQGNNTDHLTLLTGLASRYRYNKHDVISNGIRIYYSRVDGDIIITPSRKIDYDMLIEKKENSLLLKDHFRL